MRPMYILAAATLALATLSTPGLAATAHNSQAGAWGPTKHNCEPTPYFRDGGCLTSFFLDGGSDEPLPPAGRYRERRRLRGLDQ